MKINARHLTVDLYNCKSNKLQDLTSIKETVEGAVQQQGYRLLNIFMDELSEAQSVVTAFFQNGHVSVHVFQELSYVAVDIFLCCENAEPEKLYKEMQKFFMPDKTKATVLKRGDFGKVKEIKPKTKTSVAPLRKIHNTGAKVIRILAHRNHQ